MYISLNTYIILIWVMLSFRKKICPLFFFNGGESVSILGCVYGSYIIQSFRLMLITEMYKNIFIVITFWISLFGSPVSWIVVRWRPLVFCRSPLVLRRPTVGKILPLLPTKKAECKQRCLKTISQIWPFPILNAFC